MSIRPAIKDDCAAIAEIYNHAVVHTAAIWNDKTVDTDNRIAWFEARQLAGFPVLVSEENGVITGYSSLATGARLTAFATPSSIRSTFTPIIRERAGPQTAGRADRRSASAE
jgi:L-amino acid N-acyltransferase YncA